MGIVHASAACDSPHPCTPACTCVHATNVCPMPTHLAGLVPDIVSGQCACEDELAQLRLNQPCLPCTHCCQHTISLTDLVPLYVRPVGPRLRGPRGLLRLLLLLGSWGRSGLGPCKACRTAPAVNAARSMPAARQRCKNPLHATQIHRTTWLHNWSAPVE
jgi:hypothetical protein